MTTAKNSNAKVDGGGRIRGFVERLVGFVTRIKNYTVF